MLLTLALLALFGGIVTTDPLLEVAAIPLLAYVMLSFAFSASDRKEINLRITRKLEKGTLYEDDPCVVKLEVENAGPPIGFLEIVDSVPPSLQIVGGSSHIIISLEEGEKFSATYSLKAPVYGNYQYDQPLLVRFAEIQETVTGTKKYDIETNLTVLPKITYAPKINIKPRKTRNWPGEIVSTKVGEGLEFYSLRDYDRGDPIRKINWKASSKWQNKLYTNQFASELGGDTIIALDARAVSEFGKPPESAINYSVRAAAVISHRLLRERNRVGLIVLGSKLQRVAPAFGKRQFDKILFTLSMTEPGEVWELNLLGRFLSLFFSTMVQVLVVSSLNDEKSIQAIRDIAHRGYSVTVISPSPISIEKKVSEGKNRKPDKFYAAGERLLRAQRQNRLMELRRVATIVDWNVELPLSAALRTQLSSQRRRGDLSRVIRLV